MKTFLALLLVVLPILGIADASYLTYEKLSGHIPVCGEGFDCGKVLQSEWSSVGPVPLSVFGLGFYISVLILAIANFLEIEFNFFKKFHKSLSTQKLLWLLSIFGFLFSLFLIFLMGVVIQGWCLYCLISAGISSSIFVVASALNLIAKQNHDLPSQ